MRQYQGMTRPLLTNERAALDALLTCDFDGAPELRRQASTVMADGSGLIIDLVVESSLPVAPVKSRVHVEAPVDADDGTPRNGLILLQMRVGCLGWSTGATDQKPDSFPAADQIGTPQPWS
jgi:hypothetical protein